MLAQPAPDRLGAVDFFGYKGLDLTRVRGALPVHEGDVFPGSRAAEDWKAAIRTGVVNAIGREPTDVAIICCDGERRYLIFVGLPGTSSGPVRFHSPPDGGARFAPDVVT